jgi:hypothetical protein
MSLLVVRFKLRELAVAKSIPVVELAILHQPLGDPVRYSRRRWHIQGEGGIKASGRASCDRGSGGTNGSGCLKSWRGTPSLIQENESGKSSETLPETRKDLFAQMGKRWDKKQKEIMI